MDAVEFIKTRAKMCKNLSCGQCPLKFFCSSSFFDQVEIAEDAASVVKQWAKEHPVKTRQSEFLKMFPETEMIDDYICICPSRVSKKYRDSNTSCSIECDKCKRDFWLKEIE